MARLSTARIILLTIVGLAVLHYTNVLAPLTSLLVTPAARFTDDPYTFGTCPPSAWNGGQWQRRERPRVAGVNDTELTRSEDIFHYNGLQGCAADREFYWHLAADNGNHFSRFPDATEWEWVPAKGCRGVKPLSAEALVKHLVEEGGWFLLGDSVTENHFFSLSCTLYPHVRATPNYTENPYFDRAWPQNLYLDPASPLVRTLDFPDGFDIAETPLVTFRRNDLLLTHVDLEELHRGKHPEMYEGFTGAPRGNFSLFGGEAHWAQSPREYWAWFTEPLPKRYATLFTNTGGHWTTTLMHGFRDEEAEGQGIRPLLTFFGHAVDRWAREVQTLLDRERAREDAERREQAAAGRAGHRKGKILRREVVVRAYATGHEDCHNFREPWAEFKPDEAYRNRWYNWAWFDEMNALFQRVLASPLYPDIHFLRIDLPQRLRPDAHGTGDCLHLMTGSGVMEGWTRYLWHFVSRELPAHAGAS
ncbi:hypothetical protein K488DRAFT_49316 [Vararia minispora EC-137]|uniref:Uncharacterized protein n=1 Tax=Vararia minispora EC-137 TaxID=1314806 RepID=A0ACB8QLH5_9AGAM|nr:hypothetical protein K488DRAFT_49316 [Vararia minispora EC-137]